MLEAFTYGVPPHGGLAHGIERLLMTITGEPYLREVVAFPMTSGGQTSVMDAPSPVSREQLEELGITVTVKCRTPEDVYRGILSFFAARKIPVTPYEHEPVHTSEEAAKVRKTPLSAGAKALVLFADGKPVMVVLPGDRKLDTKEFKHTFGIRDLRMATPEEVLTITGVPIGAVPPFGHLFDIALYMDERMRDNERIVFNAGYHTKSVEVIQKDYEMGTKPIVASFSR
jgi:prolyl-tRNA editing enzyme YbaK/EbsC (Cys-tRNA(Pro) deacylase)